MATALLATIVMLNHGLPADSAYLVHTTHTALCSSIADWLCCLVQDLELWISKEVMEDGFTLVTRAGRTVQELKVTTAVPLEEMKSAIQRVLQRLT